MLRRHCPSDTTFLIIKGDLWVSESRWMAVALTAHIFLLGCLGLLQRCPTRSQRSWQMLHVPLLRPVGSQGYRKRVRVPLNADSRWLLGCLGGFGFDIPLPQFIKTMADVAPGAVTTLKRAPRFPFTTPGKSFSPCPRFLYPMAA